MAEVAALNELPGLRLPQPDGVDRGHDRRDERDAPRRVHRDDDHRARPLRPQRRPSRTPPTASWRSRPRPARSGRRAAATSRRQSPRMPRTPRPSRRRPSPTYEVYLDLDDCEAGHEAWEESNRAWLEQWTGREDGAEQHVRVPFPARRRAARADRGMHAGRGPHLHAVAVTHADAVAHTDPDADAEPTPRPRCRPSPCRRLPTPTPSPTPTPLP